MYEFKLPDVGEGIHEAEILAWLVKVGEQVKRDQPIVEIQTDKAVVEIPAPVAGTIAEIRLGSGTLARVGQVLVAIAPEGIATTTAETGPGRRVLAAPAVRKLALELGLDLSHVAGSGPAGRVLPSDVRRAAEEAARISPPQPALKSEAAALPALTQAKEQPAAPPPFPAASLPQPQSDQELVEEAPLQGLRRRIAERMEQAWQIPHVTSFEEVDASSLVALRRHLQPEAERRGVRLTYLPFIIKATLQTLKEFPYFNATLDMRNQKVLLRRYYHIGVAMAVPEGLLAPVIRHANRLNLAQLAGELNRLAEGARERRLSQAELTGSTFTITNFGSFGGWQGTPIINPPEAAILGCGRIEEKPVVVDGQIAARWILPLALSFDHRLIDGAAAAQFLHRLKTLLADPNLLWLELA